MELKTVMWGLAKGLRCQRPFCRGSFEVQIYPDGIEIVCMECGRSPENKVPSFILGEIERYKGKRSRGNTGIPEFKCY